MLIWKLEYVIRKFVNDLKVNKILSERKKEISIKNMIALWMAKKSD